MSEKLILLLLLLLLSTLSSLDFQLQTKNIISFEQPTSSTCGLAVQK